MARIGMFVVLAILDSQRGVPSVGGAPNPIGADRITGCLPAVQRCISWGCHDHIV
jgi:hypothetical protein